MGDALLAGSAAAAFLAGLVAFFAPCCATVMLPSYLAASTAGGRRWHVVPLTGVYIAGVATVVWPLTIGVAGIASLVNEYHSALFVVGGTMMLVIGFATLRGWMWSAPVPQPRPGKDVGSVFLMGIFAGAATACCAPVLAGAVTIAGVSGSWWVGALLGGFYLLGLVTPLLVAGLGVKRLQDRLRDPALTLRVAGRTLHTTRMRLIAAVMFVGVGALMIVLALTGQADSAPGVQRAFGRWLSEQAGWLAERTPFALGWALMLAFVAALVAILWRTRTNHRINHRAKEESG